MCPLQVFEQDAPPPQKGLYLEEILLRCYPKYENPAIMSSIVADCSEVSLT